MLASYMLLMSGAQQYAVKHFVTAVSLLIIIYFGTVVLTISVCNAVFDVSFEY